MNHLCLGRYEIALFPLVSRGMTLRPGNIAVPGTACSEIQHCVNAVKAASNRKNGDDFKRIRVDDDGSFSATMYLKPRYCGTISQLFREGVNLDAVGNPRSDREREIDATSTVDIPADDGFVEFAPLLPRQSLSPD